MFDFRFRALLPGCSFAVRRDGIEKHQYVQPTPLIDEFFVRYPIITSHSAKNGEGAVVIVGAV